jgi:hypothetical protein
MASIRKEIQIETTLGDAWSALRDLGTLHERLPDELAAPTQQMMGLGLGAIKRTLEQARLAADSSRA